MNPLFKIKNLSTVALTTLVIGLSSLQPAVAGTPDARVREALDKAGLKYEITSDGDFKVLLKFEDDRTQVVLINSDTEKLNDTNMEIREVYSAAYKINGNLPADVANKMMKDSQKRKIGSWESIYLDSGNSLAVFDAKISTEISSNNLEKVIRLVAIRADIMEKELTNEDKF